MPPIVSDSTKPTSVRVAASRLTRALSRLPMELQHSNTAYPIFRTIAVVVAIAQTLIAVGFIAGGDFGIPLAFSMSWLLPAIVLLIAGIWSPSRILLTVCIALNLLGVLYLWIGFVLFPAWLYGNILTSYGAHTLFVGCASLVNVAPVIVCMTWHSKLRKSNAG